MKSRATKNPMKFVETQELCIRYQLSSPPLCLNDFQKQKLAKDAEPHLNPTPQGKSKAHDASKLRWGGGI
jgi:hypothetical protein